MASKSMCLSLCLTLSMFAMLSIETINGFTIELIHPDSPSNPLRNPSKTQFDWIREAYNITRSRAASIQNDIDGSSKFKTDLRPSGGGYVMKYSLGTPAFETYGIADTGSDITWTQCKPCTDCFEQGLPMFDPKNSKSYKTTSCNSNVCSIVQNSQCSNNNICQYEVSYGDRSKTIGDVAVDTLTLGNSSFKNVAFGCGHQNGGTFSNGTSGIVGLGNSAVSIIKQLDEQIGGKFAYCLSPERTSKSHISFGQDAIVKGLSTPIFIRRDQPSFYWLSLKSITVGNTNLLLKPSSKYNVGGRRGSKATTAGNIIIDSGTTLTMIPSDLFADLKTALAREISATPIDDPQGTFGLCYATSDDIKVPRIIAHFAGADVELSPKGSYLEVQQGMSCFTIIPDTEIGISIFGNLSELDYLVGYDLKAKTVTFKPADCSKF